MTVHGADIAKFRDKENFDNSLIHIAVKANHQDVVTFLITNGLDVNI